LPLVFSDAKDYDKIDLGDELFIANTSRALDQPLIRVKNCSRDYEFAVTFTLTPRQIEIIRAGGLLNYMRR
jgi:aconitate hydratase